MSMHLPRMIYYLIEVQCLYSGLKNTPWIDRPLSVQRKLKMMCCCPDSDFQIHGEFCTNLDVSNPSVIYGWKDGEVYFHMQLMAHRFQLCRLSYACFSEYWYRTLLQSNWVKTNSFSPTRRDVPSMNSTPTPP
jgi:hypothetical protein